MEYRRYLFVSDVHYCQESYGGLTRDEKAERTLCQIREEYVRAPYERIFFLGDYSLDHWGWNGGGTWITEGRSYTRDFVEKYCRDLPAPYCMIAGNHEQFGEALWQELTGFGRSAVIEDGDCLFILWDSFGADLDPAVHSDGTYTAPDVRAIRAAMDAHPGKKVFLCSHYFAPNGSEEEAALIADPRVVCLVAGHTHSAKVITLPEAYGGKKILQTGSWGGVGPQSETHWGVRDLCVYVDRVESAYFVQGNDLTDKGISYTVPAGRQDTAEIFF